MFTLLPEQHKKRLFKEYRIRLAITFLIIVSVFFIIGIALLFPSYISLQTEKSTYKTESDALSKQIELKDKEGLTTTMDMIQSELSLVKPDETQIFRAINAILNQTTSDISILSLGYTRGDKSPSSINIQGVAKDRASLLTFSNNLKKELLFTSVDLPVSNLAKQTDVKFNLTLLGRF
jgi:Tfp pilus assembly protein PilN